MAVIEGAGEIMAPKELLDSGYVEKLDSDEDLAVDEYADLTVPAEKGVQDTPGDTTDFPTAEEPKVYQTKMGGTPLWKVIMSGF